MNDHTPAAQPATVDGTPPALQLMYDGIERSQGTALRDAIKAALALAAVHGRLPSTREPLPFASLAAVAATAVEPVLAAKDAQIARAVEFAQAQTAAEREAHDALHIRIAKALGISPGATGGDIERSIKSLIEGVNDDMVKARAGIETLRAAGWEVREALGAGEFEVTADTARRVVAELALLRAFHKRALDVREAVTIVPRLPGQTERSRHVTSGAAAVMDDLFHHEDTPEQLQLPRLLSVQQPATSPAEATEAGVTDE